jgi:hypothetical protein
MHTHFTSLSEVLACLFFYRNFVGVAGGGASGHFWSLSPTIMRAVTWPRRTARLMSNVQMGVVALTTAAVLLGIVRSPHAKKVKGMALLKRATSNSQGKSAREGSERRPNSITLQSSTAPEEQRSSATQRGGKLSPAMRISRKETPHIAESRRILSR